jgi:hypothetical protein
LSICRVKETQAFLALVVLALLAAEPAGVRADRLPKKPRKAQC